jgi:hypothetical protein
MMVRILLLHLVLLLPISPIIPRAMHIGQSKPQNMVAEISAREPWYIERAEKEQTFEGTLRKREVPLGPGGRGGLNFNLSVKGADYPVYTGGADEKLRPFLGRFVRVRAKLVDLTKEGLGKELWLGSLQVVSGS